MRWRTRDSRSTKYGAIKTTVDGITFDSIKEANRWQALRLLERAGKITALNRQLRIEIVPKTKLHKPRYYVCDFVYFDKEKNKTIYEDVKGYKKGLAYQMFTLKRDILYWRHQIEIIET